MYRVTLVQESEEYTEDHIESRVKSRLVERVGFKPDMLSKKIMFMVWDKYTFPGNL